MISTNYTEDMVARLEQETFFDLEVATLVGKEIGKSAKSVTAKAKSLGIQYFAKERAAPVGVISKKAYVSAIEAAFDITLVSGVKMTKVDLVRLTDSLGLEVS
jgi:hypothetical protein